MFTQFSFFLPLCRDALLRPPRRFSLSTRPCYLVLLTLLGCGLSVPAAVAQPAKVGSIAGQVEPIHDHDLTLATARIQGLRRSVPIAADGTFRFDEVRPGAYLVEVRIPTLGGAVERVVVSAGKETALVVEVKPGSHFEEVVVSATGDARDSLELAAPVTTLSGAELMSKLESSLGETLSQEAGVSSSFFGPGASRPIIRGLSGDRVRMLEGGIGTGDASDVSADHAVTTDPVQAERIEVLRGPATLLYGSSAIGGAVNVIDERIPTTRATSAINGTVDVRAGSVSNEQVAALNLGGGREDWAWHADMIARDTDDYEVPGAVIEESPEFASGLVPNTDLESQGARFGVSRFFGGRGFFGAAIGGSDTEYGIPGEGEEEPVRLDVEQRRLDLRGELHQDFGPFQAAKFRLGATDYEHAELEGEEVGTRFFNDFLEARVELVQKQRGSDSGPAGNGSAGKTSWLTHSGSVGVQLIDRTLEAVGEEAFIPKTATERWALFTLQEMSRGAVTWQFGARLERQEHVAEGFRAVSHQGISGSVGLVWSLSDNWSVGASVARSVKLPASEELFSDGPHVASQSFELGDVDLEEEVGLGADVSLRKVKGRVTGEVTLFRQEFNDFIFQAFTGEVRDDFPVLLFSQQDARLRGAELTARLELFERGGHHMHVEVVGDLVRAELETGGNLPRTPPRRLSGGLHYHSEQWTAAAEVRWVDAQDDLAVNETRTSGHTFVNANVSRRLIFKGQILDLLVRVRNLTDEEARSHTSLIKRLAPLPGRDITLSARFWF